MMRSVVTPFILLAMFASASLGQSAKKIDVDSKKDAKADSKPAPTAPPHFGSVQAVRKKAGLIELAEVFGETVFEARPETFEKDGKSETRTVVVPVVKVVRRTTRVAVLAGQVFDAGGKAVKPAEVWKKLEIGMPVLISSDGRRIPASYRNLVKKGTLIFVPADDDVPGLKPPPDN